MGPTSPLSVGGGVFELGFSARSALFSCPGLLEEWSPSAWRVPSRVCACAVSPANVAAANAAEPIPRTLLLESPSCILLPFFSSLITFFPCLRMCSESGQCSRSQCSRAHSQNTPSRKPVLHPVALLLITHHVLSLCIVNSTPHSCLCDSTTSRKHVRCQSSLDW